MVKVLAEFGIAIFLLFRERRFDEKSISRIHLGQAGPCTLLVLIDDVTSRLMQLRFVPSKSTDLRLRSTARLS
jgi:hypothetical protein